jgi:hypothetical protein
MSFAIFYVCFVLYVVCVLASCWMMYHGSKITTDSDKLLDNVQTWILRLLLLIAAVSLVGICYNWPGGV